MSVEMCGIQARPFFFVLVLISLFSLMMLYMFSGTTTFGALSWTYFSHDEGGFSKQSRPTNSSISAVLKAIGVPTDQQLDEQDTEPPKPVLTLFTTFKSSPDRFSIHSNVLKNWAQFFPVIRAILYSTNTDPKLVSLAKELGWLVLPAPAVNNHGTPFLKEMFLEAQKQVDSTFYGYSNGDLLYEKGLVMTIQAVQDCLDTLHSTLIVGMRTNYKIGNQILYKSKDVESRAKKGSVFRADAEDYFLIAHNEFPWKRVPKLVIGRPAYDNFLVATAIKNGVSVIDATKTLFALHQTGKDGDFAGHKNRDAGFNSKAIGPFNYGAGLTISAPYQTLWNSKRQVEIWTRSRKSKKQRKIEPTNKKSTPDKFKTHPPTVPSSTQNVVRTTVLPSTGSLPIDGQTISPDLVTNTSKSNNKNSSEKLSSFKWETMPIKNVNQDDQFHSTKENSTVLPKVDNSSKQQNDTGSLTVTKVFPMLPIT